MATRSGERRDPAAAEGREPSGEDNWPPLDYEDVDLDPRTVKRHAGNARFMTAAQMKQLSDNMRRDGKVLGTLLGYRDPDTGEVEMLSGHQRADAAIQAGFTTVPFKVITSRLSDQRKRAILLSQNALVGQDDSAKLAALYADLDLTAKSYSGLDDSILKANAMMQLGGLSVGMKYQELTLYFLPEDASVVQHALARLEKSARKQAAYVAAYSDFDAFFDAAVRVKNQGGVFNSAIAMRMLVDLAMKALDELEPEVAEGSA